MSNRKDFLQQSALLAAGLLFAPSCISAKSNMKIGLQLYTLREIIGQNVPGVIKKVAQIGYQNVETYGFSSNDLFWGLKPKDFKSILDDNNLVSSSGHYSIEDFIRTDNKEELQLAIEAAKHVGQEYLTVPYLSEDLRLTADDFRMIADKLNQAAEMCKEADLKLAYHNHDFEFKDLGDGESGYKIFLKNTDPDLVQFEMDLYWIIRSGNDPLVLFNENPGRFVMWHIKDMDKANPEINTEVGAGSIDFKSIFKESKQSGLKHIFMEQENFSMDPFESIKESHDYIKKELI